MKKRKNHTSIEAAKDAEYIGQYRYRPTGEVFGLLIKDRSQVRQGRTHYAKGPQSSWDGTPADFQKLFDRI